MSLSEKWGESQGGRRGIRAETCFERDVIQVFGR